MIIDTVEGFKVLQQFGMRVAGSKIGAGTDITVAGRTDPSTGKIIAVRSAERSVERMVPLDSLNAEWLAANHQLHHHHGRSEQARRMLEHLLLRVSNFFENSGVTEFALTVRLHDNAYTIIEASMTAPKALHLKARLDAHARDRKGESFFPMRHS